MTLSVLWRSGWPIGAALFLLSVCVLQWQNADRFLLSLDEGIYLDGAQRVSQGQAPYRDFFTFTGPVDFWLYGAVFRLFGATLGNARLLLSLEVAFLCTAIYWLLSQLTEPLFAAIAACSFLALCLDLYAVLYVSHRWDSNASAMAALTLACMAAVRNRKGYWIGAGACAGMAAWATPTFAIVAAILVLWVAFKRRGGLAYFVAGLALSSGLALSVLAYQGTVLPMLQQLLWATTHYSAPNRVPYGYAIGDEAAAWHAAHGAGALYALLRWLESSLPAILPVGAYLGLGLLWFFRRERLRHSAELLGLLILFSVGVLAAGLPRLGTHQLVFLTPVFWVLGGYVLFTALGLGWRLTGAGALALLAFLMFASSIRRDALFTDVVETNAGPVRCTAEDAKLVAALTANILPGDGLFVFPYLPIANFLTGGQNPSRFSFLQPGMMDAGDEAAVLAELHSRPPKWMLRSQYPPRFWTLNWPNTDPSRLGFPSLEALMQSDYRQVLQVEMRGQQLFLSQRLTP